MEKRFFWVYDYNELSEEAKEKARQDFIDAEDFEFLQDDLKEFVEAELTDKGIKIADDSAFEVYYSLTHSQGDGFQFVGRFEWRDNFYFITSIGRYFHSQAVRISATTKEGNYTIVEKEINRFRAVYDEICKKAEDYGYSVIDCYWGEAFLKDVFEMNNYKFKKDGSII